MPKVCAARTIPAADLRADVENARASINDASILTASHGTQRSTCSIPMQVRAIDHDLDAEPAHGPGESPDGVDVGHDEAFVDLQRQWQILKVRRERAEPLIELEGPIDVGDTADIHVR
jgi:hypothetical protein